MGPLEINGAIPRVVDYAQFKHNEDTKSAVMQGVLTADSRKEDESKATQVVRGDEASNYLKRFDAKEKGSNEYSQNTAKKKAKKEPKDGNVSPKGSTSSFDIRI